MEIKIVWGKSEGETLISSFDKSLLKAGIHNFNLIYLSSIIPQKAVVTEVGTYKSNHKIGDILHVVISTISSDKAGAQITAGLGWVKTAEGGLLFESNGQFSPEKCSQEIEKGLTEMMSARGWQGEIKMKVISHRVKKKANITVAAVYDF